MEEHTDATVVLIDKGLNSKDIQAKIEALKRSIPKGDKKKKREISAEIAILEQKLWEVQDEEETSVTSAKEEAADNAVTAEMSDMSIAKKKNKAQRRREQKASQDRERAQRIAQAEEVALSEENNPRLLERRKLSSILEPLGLAIKDIPPDGHCLYAAVSDQLLLRLGLKTTVAEVRTTCANHIRFHKEDFLPYMADPSTGNQMSTDQFEEYCYEIESSAVWGGLLELRAISNMYNVSISIYQASSSTIHLGDGSSERTLTLSYHLHEYGLGEHYNSVVPVTAAVIG